MRSALTMILAAMVAFPSSMAEERRYPLPDVADGWLYGTEGVAVSDRRVAVSGIMLETAADGVRVVTHSRIVQFGDGAPGPIDFEGKATAVEYAHDGGTLHVRRLLPGQRCCGNCRTQSILIGPDGSELWRTDGSRQSGWHLTPDRRTLVASRVDEIELRTLDGRSTFVPTGLDFRRPTGPPHATSGLPAGPIRVHVERHVVTTTIAVNGGSP